MHFKRISASKLLKIILISILIIALITAGIIFTIKVAVPKHNEKKEIEQLSSYSEEMNVYIPERLPDNNIINGENTLKIFKLSDKEQAKINEDFVVSSVWKKCLKSSTEFMKIKYIAANNFTELRNFKSESSRYFVYDNVKDSLSGNIQLTDYDLNIAMYDAQKKLLYIMNVSKN